MLFTLAALAFTIVSGVHAQLRIETPPSLVECQPASIAFSGGTAPYFIAILPAGQVSAPAIANLPESSSSPITWVVNLPANTNISLRLTDSTGIVAYSSPSVVQAGSDQSCITGDSSGSASSTPSGSAASSGSAAPSGSATPSTSAGSTTTTSSASSASSSAAGTSSGSPTSSAPASGTSTPANSSGPAILTANVQGGFFAILGLIAAGFGVAV